MNKKIILGMCILLILPIVNAGTWSGYVLDDATSNPLIGATINAYNSTTLTLVNTTTTDGTGFFNTTINEGVYFNTTLNGYHTDTSQQLPTPPGDNILPFNITLIQTLPGTITGNVNNGTDNLTEATINILQGGIVIATNTTNSNGDYTINDLTDGTYDLETTATGYIGQNVSNIIITPGGTTTQDFQLTLTPIICTDADGDGYYVEAWCTPIDFDDTDAARYPGAACTRTCYSGSIYDTSGSCTGGTYTCGSSCFPAGTKILMADGEKNIEEVKVGDKVLGYDGEEKVSVEVLELESPIRDHMYTLYFEDGTTLKLTKEHPLYTEQGWKSISPKATAEENAELEVGELKVGDKVFNKQEKYVKVIKIGLVKGTIQTYNLKKVSQNNNFYADGYLAHNKGGGGSSGTTYNINLTSGAVIQKLGRSDRVRFEYENIMQFITNIRVSRGNVSLKVTPTMEYPILASGKAVLVDLDEDGKTDIKITNLGVINGKADLKFELIKETTPMPEFEPTTKPEPTTEPEIQKKETTLQGWSRLERVKKEETTGEEDKEKISKFDEYKEKIKPYMKYIAAGIIAIVLIGIYFIFEGTGKNSASKKPGKKAMIKIINFFSIED